jgi:hypothetical protein
MLVSVISYATLAVARTQLRLKERADPASQWAYGDRLQLLGSKCSALQPFTIVTNTLVNSLPFHWTVSTINSIASNGADAIRIFRTREPGLPGGAELWIDQHGIPSIAG